MSLILDALRKMEQDRKSRRGAALDIRPEVLRYRAAVKPQQAKPHLLVAIGLILLTAGIGAGILLKGNRGVTAAQTTEPSAPTAAVAPVAPAPMAVDVPSAAPAPALPESRAALPAAAIARPESQPRSVSAPVEHSGSKPARKPAVEARPARAEAAATPQAKALRRDAPEDLQPAIPDISISGIAWQDERRLRRAVLNGVLVGEGAEVAGARVVEIRENRVRLSRGGQLFDVLFSSGFSSH